MPEFDPEKFEDKYVHYFDELQRAYKTVFETMNEEFDSTLIHAIDQQILNESEPFYDGDGQFTIALPDNPSDRVEGVVVDQETLDSVLSEYVDRLEDELRRMFGFTE